jgi:hypothetical protein
MTTKPAGPEQVAAQSRQALLAERDKFAHLEGRLSTAEAELAALDASAGGTVLDDPESAGQVARDLAELRARIEILERAIAVQGERVVEAERAFLLAEAEALSNPVTAARGALERHQARTEELLEELRKHEGAFVPKGWLDSERIAVGTPRVVETYVSSGLADALELAELPVLVRQEMAAGRDPSEHQRLRGVNDPAAVYGPSVWGPEALVSAPAWQRRCERAAAAEQQRLDNTSMVEARIVELEAKLADPQHRDEPKRQDGTQPPTLTKQLEAARRQLALLTAPTGEANQASA